MTVLASTIVCVATSVEHFPENLEETVSNPKPPSEPLMSFLNLILRYAPRSVDHDCRIAVPAENLHRVAEPRPEIVAREGYFQSAKDVFLSYGYIVSADPFAIRFYSWGREKTVVPFLLSWPFT